MSEPKKPKLSRQGRQRRRKTPKVPRRRPPLPPTPPDARLSDEQYARLLEADATAERVRAAYARDADADAAERPGESE